MNQLSCAGCGRGFKTQDLDLSVGLAWCVSCGAVTNVRMRALATEAFLEAMTRPAPPRPMVVLPASFQVSNEGDRFSVSWRSFPPVLAVGLALGVLFSLGLALAPADEASALMGAAWFKALAVVQALGAAYGLLVVLLNRTEVSLESGTLRVTRGPVPMGGNRSLTREALSQLFASERVVRRRQGTTTSYELGAVLRDGRRLTLLGGLPSRDQVVWLEQTFEKRLGLVDRAVKGELDRASAASAG
jgi:hypothetical protein